MEMSVEEGGGRYLPTYLPTYLYATNQFRLERICNLTKCVCFFVPNWTTQVLTFHSSQEKKKKKKLFVSNLYVNAELAISAGLQQLREAKKCA
jgi:hypothetical protein